MTTNGNFDDVPCLAPYGGPALPFVVLGGFRNGEEHSVSDEHLYMNATALVLTFLINNRADQEQLEPAQAWEKA